MTNPNINPEWQKRFNEHLSVTWRGTLPPHRETGEVAVFFDLPGGGTLRLRMPTHDARQLMGSLAYCLEQHHSDRSSGIPSESVSTPLDGFQVCPPATSAAAKRAEPYGPSDSP